MEKVELVHHMETDWHRRRPDIRNCMIFEDSFFEDDDDVDFSDKHPDDDRGLLDPDGEDHLNFDPDDDFR
jgi:hypothetical protein